jgi:hypothetical protein
MAQESRQQADLGLAPSAAPRDPNFRQLSRAPFVERLRAASKAAEQPDGQSRAATSPSGGDAFSSTASSPLGEGPYDTYPTRAALTWAVAPPRVTPVPIGFRGRPFPSGPMPTPSPTSPQKIPVPEIPDAWKALGTMLGLLPGLVLERFSSSGGRDDHNRCAQAAEGDYEDWMAFCDSLPQRVRGNTVGAETIKRACQSKGFESEINKKQWCANQFGKGL